MSATTAFQRFYQESYPLSRTNVNTLVAVARPGQPNEGSTCVRTADLGEINAFDVL